MSEAAIEWLREVGFDVPDTASLLQRNAKPWVAKKGPVTVCLIRQSSGLWWALFECHLGGKVVAEVQATPFTLDDPTLLKQGMDALVSQMKQYFYDLDTARDLVHEWSC